jgi:hypothetical protein
MCNMRHSTRRMGCSMWMAWLCDLQVQMYSNMNCQGTCWRLCVAGICCLHHKHDVSRSLLTIALLLLLLGFPLCLPCPVLCDPLQAARHFKPR